MRTRDVCMREGSLGVSGVDRRGNLASVSMGKGGLACLARGKGRCDCNGSGRGGGGDHLKKMPHKVATKHFLVQRCCTGRTRGCSEQLCQPFTRFKPPQWDELAGTAVWVCVVPVPVPENWPSFRWISTLFFRPAFSYFADTTCFCSLPSSHILLIRRRHWHSNSTQHRDLTRLFLSCIHTGLIPLVRARRAGTATGCIRTMEAYKYNLY